MALLRTSLEVAPNVAYFLPRTSTSAGAQAGCGGGRAARIERNFLNRREKAITAYYGFEEEAWEAEEDDPLFT